MEQAIILIAAPLMIGATCAKFFKPIEAIMLAPTVILTLHYIKVLLS